MSAQLRCLEILFFKDLGRYVLFILKIPDCLININNYHQISSALLGLSFVFTGSGTESSEEQQIVSQSSSPTEKKRTGTASVSYEGEDGFFVTKGEKVKEKKRNSDGWSKIKRSNGETGYIPSVLLKFQ